MLKKYEKTHYKEHEGEDEKLFKKKKGKGKIHKVNRFNTVKKLLETDCVVQFSGLALQQWPLRISATLLQQHSANQASILPSS